MVRISNLLDEEKNPDEAGLAVVADEGFNVYYVDSDGSYLQILGKLPDQQLSPKVAKRPLPETRAPLIFPSGTVVDLAITKEGQTVARVQITKV